VGVSEIRDPYFTVRGFDALKKWRDNGTMVKNAAERAGRSKRFAARCRSDICRANSFAMFGLMSVAVEFWSLSNSPICDAVASPFRVLSDVHATSADTFRILREKTKEKKEKGRQGTVARLSVVGSRLHPSRRIATLTIKDCHADVHEDVWNMARMNQKWRYQ
jgi:hypothetical protein